jgi:hypothetical protein
MEAWLESKGVRFRKGTCVRDIETQNQGKETVATALVYDDDSGHQEIKLTRDDLVFFTNGSMVTKTTWGDNDTVATYDRDTSDMGAPFINDTLAGIRCHIEREVDVGDHVIVLGRVVQLRQGTPAPPLLYFGGRYRSLRDVEARDEPHDVWNPDAVQVIHKT